MKLSFLFEKIGLVPVDDFDDVTLVTDEPGQVTRGCVYVCIRGDNSDGHAFALSAVEMGAAVIGEQDIGTDNYYRVEDSRSAFAFLCSAFYGCPGEKLKLIGITGTNGKTTTAEYIRHILENSGHKCGLIGTEGILISGRHRKTGYTTPGGNILYSALADMVKSDCEYCVMEVSSQALAQRRCDALRFAVGVFTNLGSEHLDYHKNTENYISAKSRLAQLSDKAVVNGDDAYSERFASDSRNGNVKYFSARNGLADYMANGIQYGRCALTYTLICSLGVAKVSFGALGEFSVYNSLAAAAVCAELGIPFTDIVRLTASLPCIPGRAQMFYDGRGVNVCVDFAHTPAALSEILLSLSGITEGGIITVFGCGGDRDPTKRPLMGRIAANMSKAVILTADNSRSESTENIISQIKSGIKRKADVFVQPERDKAITLALNKANPGDTVLIAGRGSETKLELPTGTVEFCDIDFVNNAVLK